MPLLAFLWLPLLSLSTEIDMYTRGQNIYGEIQATSQKSSCFAAADSLLVESCIRVLVDGDETLHKYIALYITNCYLEMTGVARIKCQPKLSQSTNISSEEVASCVKTISTHSATALQLFVSQLDRVYDACMFLEFKAYQRHALMVSRTLLETAQNTSDDLESIAGLVKDSRALLEGQTRDILNLSRVATDALENTTARYTRVIQNVETFIQSTDESFAQLHSKMEASMTTQDEVSTRFNSSAQALAAKVDELAGSIDAVKNVSERLLGSVNSTAAQLDGVDSKASELLTEVGSLFTKVAEGSAYMNDIHKSGKETVKLTIQAVNAIEKHAQRQARILADLNTAMDDLASSVGASKIGFLTIYQKINQYAPGGLIFYSGFQLVCQVIFNVMFRLNADATTRLKQFSALLSCMCLIMEVFVNSFLQSFLNFVYLGPYAWVRGLSIKIFEHFRLPIANLIVRKYTCKRAPNYDLCLSTTMQTNRFSFMSAREAFFLKSLHVGIDSFYEAKQAAEQLATASLETASFTAFVTSTAGLRVSSQAVSAIFRFACIALTVAATAYILIFYTSPMEHIRGTVNQLRDQISHISPHKSSSYLRADPVSKRPRKQTRAIADDGSDYESNQNDPYLTADDLNTIPKASSYLTSGRHGSMQKKPKGFSSQQTTRLYGAADKRGVVRQAGSTKRATTSE